MTLRQKRELFYGLLFVSPWIMGMLMFVLYPVLASLYYSFCYYSVLSEPKFIGLGNYFDLFTDSVFWGSVLNTFYYAVFALPLGIAISVTLAMLLTVKVRGVTIYRTIFFLPSLLPVVALAILWLWIFNGEYGVLNFALSKLGIEGPNWLAEKNWAMPALIIMSFWGVGHMVVIYLASLQDVPQVLYEAAELDGASWWHKARHITLPMISPVIYFNLIMGIIGTLQIFAQPYIMTGGGPARATLFYTMYLYDNGFRYLRMGYASAMAWILFIIILLLTLVATRISRKYIYYEGG